MARRGFTLIELIAVVVIVLAVTALIIPVVGQAVQLRRRTETSLQLSTIHQAMVRFAQGNRFWFPGATSSGMVDANTAVAVRHGSIMRLQHDDFIESDDNVSPAEIDREVSSQGMRATTPNERGSFAVLEYATSAAGTNLTIVGMHHWYNNFEPNCLILSDRQTGVRGEPRSIWSRRNDQWQGHLCFVDGHVEFEKSDGPHDRFRYFDWGGCKVGERPNAPIGMLFSAGDGNGVTRLVAD